MSNKMSAETERLLAEAMNVDALRHKLALLNIEAQHRLSWYRSHYNPDQPRVPAGDPRGGQWTRTGGGGARGWLTGAENRPAFLTTDSVLSDATPDPITVWSQYAQNESDHGSQDPAIELTKEILYDILIQVNGAVSARRDPLSARLYGVIVHAEFARAVRARNLPGIGTVGVEQSFDPDGLARYGLDGSIRTDIVLRNEQRQIIAIYDVKTGNATMEPAREAKIRAYTRVGREVPVIILHAVRGLGSP